MSEMDYVIRHRSIVITDDGGYFIYIYILLLFDNLKTDKVVIFIHITPELLFNSISPMTIPFHLSFFDPAHQSLVLGYGAGNG